MVLLEHIIPKEIFHQYQVSFFDFGSDASNMKLSQLSPLTQITNITIFQKKIMVFHLNIIEIYRKIILLILLT